MEIEGFGTCDSKYFIGLHFRLSVAHCFLLVIQPRFSRVSQDFFFFFTEVHEDNQLQISEQIK